ncbi:MAG: hypothetical protein AB8H80_09630 [Planctomycetota bacterium]
MSHDPKRIARERQLDWLLEEALDGAGEVAGSRPVRARASTSMPVWLAAALVVLAVGVAFGVFALRDRRGGEDRNAAEAGRSRGAVDLPRVDLPNSDPPSEEPWHHCRGSDQLGDVPAGVTSLKCYGFDDEALARLARFAKLERLDLSGTSFDAASGLFLEPPITDAGVAHLCGLTSLRWLSLRGCLDVTGLTLGKLGQIPQLESLDLSGTGVVSKGISQLPKLDKLRTLELVGCKDFDGSSLADIATIRGLRELHLQGCPTVTADDVMQLAKLRELQLLDLRDCRGSLDRQRLVLTDVTNEQDEAAAPVGDGVGITDAAVAMLSDLPLRELKLGGCRALTNGVGAGLQRMSKLEALGLGSLPKTSAALLEQLPTGLLALSVSGNRQFDREGLKQLARFPKLLTLDLSGLPKVDDDVLTHVLTGMQLQSLRLDGISTMALVPASAAETSPRLSSAIGAALAKQRELHTLHAAFGGWLDADCAMQLAKLPKLVRLEAPGNPVDAAACTALARSPSLKRLILYGNETMTLDAVRALEPLSLEYLHLAGTKLSDDDVRKLTKTWQQATVVLPNGKTFLPR